MLKIFPKIDSKLLEKLKEEADAITDAVESECVDLADTITQWQAQKLKLAEARKRRRDD